MRNLPLQFSYNITIILNKKLFAHTLLFEARIIYHTYTHIHTRARCRSWTCYVTDYYISAT